MSLKVAVNILLYSQTFHVLLSCKSPTFDSIYLYLLVFQMVSPHNCVCTALLSRYSLQPYLPLFVHQSSQKPHFPILRSCRRPFLAKQTRPPLHPSVQEAVLVSVCPLALERVGDLRPRSRQGVLAWLDSDPLPCLAELSAGWKQQIVELWLEEMTVPPATAPLSSQYPQAGLEAVLC